MRRLYQAAATKLGRELGQAELAREMNTSSQAVKNWETRGLSKEAALTAQERFGVDANQLLGNSNSFQQSHQAPHKAKEPQPWDWPFAEVTTSDWATLMPDEKRHVENGIKMMLKARDAPSKQSAPAYTITTRTG